MPSFVVYDLIFLVLFTIVVIFLLHRDRKNLKRHGWIFLYHSKFGLRFIDWVAKTFSRVLKPLQYLVITSGYILMAFIVWMVGFSVWRYVTSPIPQQLVNVPPIAPLIPYFPRLFGLDSFFPPLFFTYFLIALAIVAVSHEFSHGIFARLNKIKVKTTGLAFLGPFFGAFVEPDEKQMAKGSKFSQLAILAAGTFANVIMTLLFLLILWGFFVVSFVPMGVNFNTYAQSVVSVDGIESIDGILTTGLDDLESLPEIEEGEFREIVVANEVFLVPDSSLQRVSESEAVQMIVFDDAPAVRLRLESPILSIDGERITSREDLQQTLGRYNPGDTIEIVSLDGDENRITQSLELIENPNDVNRGYLGVGFIEGRKGFVGSLFTLIQEIRDPLIYYETTWNGDFAQFIYDLIWWIIVINILVALFNMLPVSMLDGGRFFYLTIWGITGNEKIGRKAFGFMTWLILALLLIMMIRWLFVVGS